MTGQAEISPFGQTRDGQQIQRITLRKGNLTASILTYGAILQSVRLAGVAHDLTLGSDRLADYEGALCYHGALVAPVANRIAGATARLGDQTLRFEANQEDRHSLHSGSTGAHAHVWQVTEAAAEHCKMTLDLPDGLGGFPGHRRIMLHWAVLDPARLRLDIRAETDAPTFMNPCNHSYWNLDGRDTWAGHQLKIMADEVVEVDADCVPTGRLISLSGHALDMRAGRSLSPGQPAMDHNWCLGRQTVPLRDVLWLMGQSGLTMTLATTQPGVQVYDGRGYGYAGLAIEPQFWPDAPSHPHFPQITLRPGETYAQTTEWRFSR